MSAADEFLVCSRDGQFSQGDEQVHATDDDALMAHAIAEQHTRRTRRWHYVRTRLGVLVGLTGPQNVCRCAWTVGAPCGKAAVGYCFDDLDHDTLPICSDHATQLHYAMPEAGEVRL